MARSGDVALLGAALDRDPSKLHVRDEPYAWTLLHYAAHRGHLAAVNLLLERGFDVNTKEQGDDTTALHWAAAAGHVAVVRRLLEAGVDPVGHGDAHEMEAIGWATCWEGCGDDAHRAVADLLIAHGARHHLFSAIATNNAAEVRRIVAADPSALERTMSRFDDFRRPLHFAVRMNRPEMVALLIELGADPLSKDGAGFPPAGYALAAHVDRALNEALGGSGKLDLFTALALDDAAAAAAIVRDDPKTVSRDGVLHLMAKRGHASAVQWLLDHGADPNAKWAHWDSDVTPLHLAVLGNHLETARVLLSAGADPSIHDSKHDSDAIGWAEFFERRELEQLLKTAES